MCPSPTQSPSIVAAAARTKACSHLWMMILIIAATIANSHISAIHTPLVLAHPHPNTTPALDLIYSTHSLRNRLHLGTVDLYHLQPSIEAKSKSSTSNQAINSHWIRWRADIDRSSSRDLRNCNDTRTTPATDATAATAYALIGDWTVVDPTLASPESTGDGIAVRQQRMKSVQICHSSSFGDSITNDEHDQQRRQSQVIPSPVEVDGVKWFECEISQLPRQAEIRLILIMQTATPFTNSENNSSTHPSSRDSYSMAMTSLTTTSTLIILPKVKNELQSVALHPDTITSPPHQTTTIDRIANDTQVRADLALFYNLTNGPNWWNRGDWNNPNVSICDWQPDVLVCDQNRTIILQMNFRQDQLISTSPIDINFVFIHITTLVVFSSPSAELDLLSLDLSNQPNIQKLILTEVGTACLVRATLSQVVIPLYLPSTSVLTYLDLSNSCLTLMNPEAISFPCLEVCMIESLLVGSFPVAGIAGTMPSLVKMIAGGSLESQTPDSQGRSGAALTRYWLENLNKLHPQLNWLAIGGSTRLIFDSFPVLHSNSLQQFYLSYHNQIYDTSMPPDVFAYLPQLTTLALAYLPNVNIDLSVFERATTALTSIDLSGTNVLGSLISMQNLSSLQQIYLDECNWGGTLPSDFAQFWPNITDLDFDTNYLVGSVPSFANLTQLHTFDLSLNNFSGTLPADFLSGVNQIQDFDLSSNNLEGPLPTFNTRLPLLLSIKLDHNLFNGALGRLFGSGEQVAYMYPQLNRIDFQSNQLTGGLPVGLWSLPQAHRSNIQLGRNLLIGEIPSPPQPTVFGQLSLSNNELSGPFPQNLTANIFDVSYTNLVGPVIIPNAFPGEPIQELKLAFTQLTCPLDLSAHLITTLDIQSAGFSGCNFNDPTVMNVHWDLLNVLDISNNNFLPFRFILYPSLTLLRARNCNLMGFVLSSTAFPQFTLQTLIADSNPIGRYFSNDQIQTFFSLIQSTISVISFINCSFSGPIQLFMTNSFYQMPNLNRLLIGSNDLTGDVSLGLFSGNSGYSLQQLPYSIQEFDISNNLQITGPLPPAVLGYSELARIDISNTGVSGPLPESWTTFVGLQQLSVEGTKLSCSDTDACTIPSWLTPSRLTSPSTSIIGAHCPQLTINQSPFTLVTLDEQYYQYQLCTCDAKFFGSTGVCQACPIGCTCEGDIIQGCFPILTVSATGDSSQSIISMPFIIPCTLSATGATLCNPNGVSWSNFDPEVILSITTSSTSYDFGQLNLTSFCAVGHTSRLCSKCAEGYFAASGRWCLECGSSAVHGFIISLNLLLLILLIVITYHNSPMAESSEIELDLYLNRSSNLSLVPNHEASSDHPSSSSTSFSLSTSQNRERSVQAVRERTKRNLTSPLNLLIFHCQQLSLLLSTTTSQPPIMTGFLSLVSGASTGFSLSSLVSLECLHHLWSIEHKVWMSLLAPGLVGSVGLCIYLYQRCGSTAPKVPNLDSLSLHESINATPSIPMQQAQKPQSSSNIPRMYGVCLALLYFFLFPCAQTVLSAIACTDTRQYDGSLNGTSSLYLNLLPWIACDSAWSSTILPPAIIGVLVWIIAFPVATTLLTYYLLQRIKSEPDTSHSVHLWPLCADLFTRFKKPYWYYEQVLLVRRLLLVGCVTLIPSDSLYLPVILFSIIQLSALIQHQLQPFESVWLNRGELVSLYLLLLNYVTVLVLHESSSGELSGHSLDNWSIVLFLSNFIFILILVGGLFLTFRLHATQLLQRIGRFICCQREADSPPPMVGDSKESSSSSIDESHLVATTVRIDDGDLEPNLNHDFHSF